MSGFSTGRARVEWRHPTDEAPPIMALVASDRGWRPRLDATAAGLALFALFAVIGGAILIGQGIWGSP